MDSVARELTSRASENTELEIIALAEDELALSYHVQVSTTAHLGNMYRRNNEPVYDTVHTTVSKGKWPAGNRLGATVWLNYEPGQGASAQPGKAIRKDFTIDKTDLNTPQFHPVDFGWKNGWGDIIDVERMTGHHKSSNCRSFFINTDINIFNS